MRGTSLTKKAREFFTSDLEFAELVMYIEGLSCGTCRVACQNDAARRAVLRHVLRHQVPAQHEQLVGVRVQAGHAVALPARHSSLHGAAQHII